MKLFRYAAIYTKAIAFCIAVSAITALSCSDMISKFRERNELLPPSRSACFAPGMRTFRAGSLIIPMDTTYQDQGMFIAYGLLYQLLDHDITVYWSIKKGKSIGDADFTASAEDYVSAAPVIGHGYRGGPFIIDATDAANAAQIINDWLVTHSVTVHRATETISVPVVRKIRTRPVIAVLADGQELIAFRYLNAAGITDSTGQKWPTVSDLTRQYLGHPDVIDPDEAAGAVYTDHADGLLFGASGLPAYTHLLIMHWEPWDDLDPDADRNDEVVAEIREFLRYSTHLVACCRAIIAVENSVNGKFITANGLAVGPVPASVQFLRSDRTCAQMDGSFQTIGGGASSFSLVPGDTYGAGSVVMVSDAANPEGTNDVLIAGYIDNSHTMDYGEAICPRRPGMVHYLGGHLYQTNLPISSNPDSQGTRLLLNSLFDLP